MGLEGNTFNIQRFNNSTTGDTALTIQRSNGNIGIGTNIPEAKLHINGNCIINDQELLNTTNSTESLSVYKSLKIFNDFELYNLSLSNMTIPGRMFSYKVSKVATGLIHFAIILNTGKVLVNGQYLSNTTVSTLTALSNGAGYDGTNTSYITVNRQNAEYSTLIILNTGKIVGLGDNSYGQLGDNSTTERTSLVAMNSSAGYDQTNAIQVSMGGGQYSYSTHTLVLLNTGKVVGCGGNSYGQLGDNSTTQRTSLVAMDSSAGYDQTNAVKISAGFRSSLLLLNTGKVVGCGYNEEGVLGTGDIDTTITTLVAMNSSAGYDQTNAIDISMKRKHAFDSFKYWKSCKLWR